MTGVQTCALPISETHQDSVVVLLFMGPTYVNRNYGVAGLHGASLPKVAMLVEDFATGYYNATGSNSTSHLRIVVATSNGTTECGGNQVSSKTGRAWAQMGNDVASWVIGRGYSGQVDIAGGSDMELSTTQFPQDASCRAAKKFEWAGAKKFEWAGPVDTKAWVDGYKGVIPQWFLYNVGDAAGCPQKCAAGWTKDDVWYVSWGAAPSELLPEIYNSANAAAWAGLSLYGYQHYGESMVFSGALTEFQACVQRPSDSTCKSRFTKKQLAGCKGLPTSNLCVAAIASGWQQLYDKLKANSRTAQETLPWSTDVKWIQ